MTTHTPGPWTAELIEAPVVNGQTIGAPNGNILAGTGQAGPDWIASVKPFSDQFYANARLIAAAPELLHACKVIVIAERDWQGKCAAAIAKATETT